MNSNIKLEEVYGKELLELAKKDDRIIAIDADVSKRMGTRYIAQNFPERHINVGIAEQNLIGVAAGLATTGMIPFAGTIAGFLVGKAWDQLRQSVAYPSLNVKIVGIYAGIATGPDGPTHQICEDISIIRSLPNFRILVPCDPLETRQAVDIAYINQGPFYIRLPRPERSNILPNNYRMILGKSGLLRDGEDIAFIACGMTVDIALKAAEKLAKENISSRVLNMSTIKPLDIEAIQNAISDIGNILTIEDHSVIGGLGSSVSEVIAENGKGKLKRIGINDCFCESGCYEKLFKKYGLTAENVVAQAKKMII